MEATIDLDRPKLTDPNGKWGIWDVRDKCWLGQGDAPNRYAEEILAKAAATIVTEMLGRLAVPKVFDDKNIRFKDTIEGRFDGTEAIRRLENRCKTKEPDSTGKSSPETSTGTASEET